MNPFRRPLWLLGLALAAAIAHGAETPAAGPQDTARLACLAAIADPAADQAPAKATSDERSLIINRCLAQTGEFGAAMVRACAAKDLASYEALLAYPEACAPFVVGCAKRVGQHGWGMVRICVEREIAAHPAPED